MAVVDDYSPMYENDTLPNLVCQFQAKDFTPINLTGATFALVMVSSTGTRKVGAGSWTIDNATAGQAHYAWNSADTNTAGSWNLQVAITIAGAAQHFDLKPLDIDPTL